MGLFNFKKKNNEEQQERPARDPNTVMMFRLLAIGYVLYLAWQSVKTYREGGEGVPELWIVVLSVALLVGGAAFLGWLTYKEYKRNQAKRGDSRYEEEEDDRYEDEDDRYEDEDDTYEDVTDEETEESEEAEANDEE